jgi:MATE family multidrug resistance protein
MQLFLLFSFFMDGFAFAGEALAGRFIGEKNAVRLKECVRALMLWGLIVAVAFTGLYALGGEKILMLLSSEPGVIEASKSYYYWAAAIPFAGFVTFTWDGIFIGATASRQMRDSMLWAVVGFVVVWAVGILVLQQVAPGSDRYGNIAMHVLMAAYFAHLLARTVYLSLKYRSVIPKNL